LQLTGKILDFSLQWVYAKKIKIFKNFIIAGSKPIITFVWIGSLMT